MWKGKKTQLQLAIFVGELRSEITIRDFTAVFTINLIAFAPAQNPYRIGLLFTHKNGDFGVICMCNQMVTSEIRV